MKAYRLTASADHHVQQIWTFSRENWGSEAADAYLTKIHLALVAALETPALLRPRPELGDGVVARLAGSHIAYARLNGEFLDVLAVLHSRMDPARHSLQSE